MSELQTLIHLQEYDSRIAGLEAEAARRGMSLPDLLAEADGKYRSAFIRAVKPRGAHGS